MIYAVRDLVCVRYRTSTPRLTDPDRFKLRPYGTRLIFSSHDDSYGQTDSYLYGVDSIETHPDIELRKKHLEDYWRNDILVRYHQPEEFDAVTLLAEFETQV